MTKNEYARSLRESSLARADHRRELYARFDTIDYATHSANTPDEVAETYSEGRIYKRQFTSHEI